jgi:hypothetical protein
VLVALIERCTGQSREPIRVEDRSGAGQASTDREIYGVADQLGAHVFGHRVTGDFVGMQVEHGRQVQPAFLGREVGDVADEPFAGCVGGEVPAEQVPRPG